MRKHIQTSWARASRKEWETCIMVENAMRYLMMSTDSLMRQLPHLSLAFPNSRSIELHKGERTREPELSGYDSAKRRIKSRKDGGNTSLICCFFSWSNPRLVFILYLFLVIYLTQPKWIVEDEKSALLGLASPPGAVQITALTRLIERWFPSSFLLFDQQLMLRRWLATHSSSSSFHSVVTFPGNA